MDTFNSDSRQAMRWQCTVAPVSWTGWRLRSQAARWWLRSYLRGDSWSRWHLEAAPNPHEPASGAITASRGFDRSPPRWNHAHGCERPLDRVGGAQVAPAEVISSRDHQMLGYA